MVMNSPLYNCTVKKGEGQATQEQKLKNKQYDQGMVRSNIYTEEAS